MPVHEDLPSHDGPYFLDEVECDRYLYSQGVYYESMECSISGVTVRHAGSAEPICGRDTFRCSPCTHERSYRADSICRIASNKFLFGGYLWLSGLSFTMIRNLTKLSFHSIWDIVADYRQLIIADIEPTIRGMSSRSGCPYSRVLDCLTLLFVRRENPGSRYSGRNRRKQVRQTQV